MIEIHPKIVSMHQAVSSTPMNKIILLIAKFVKMVTFDNIQIE